MDSNKDAGTALAVPLAEAARMLSVSTRTIHRLARDGRIRIVRITADTPRVLLADLEAFLAACLQLKPVADNIAESDAL